MIMSFDLDEYQQSAWELFLSGKNVALFGRAGCGKSAVLSRAIDYAQRVHGATGVGVMAWTSQAASLINGMTFHKFLAIGIAELPKEVILEKVRSNHFVSSKVRATRVIFIDEVALFPARWFAVLEFVVRQLAPPFAQAKPWGDVQVVGKSAPFLSVAFLVFMGSWRSQYVLVPPIHHLLTPFTHSCVARVFLFFSFQLVVTFCSWNLLSRAGRSYRNT